MDATAQWGAALLAEATEGILVCGRDGRIRYANPAAYLLFNYPAQELQGLSIDALVPDNVRSGHASLRESYAAHPVRKPMGHGRDLRARRSDGSEFPVEVSLTPLDSPEGPVIAALVTDITERKRLEEQVHRLNRLLEKQVVDRTRELNYSQQLYRAVARNYPNGTISVLDEALRYEFVEGKELFALRITSEALHGNSYLEQLPAEVRGEVEGRLRRALAGADVQFELEHHGEHYRIDAVALQVEGTPKVLVVEQNISAVTAALKKERHLNELKSRFVSMASHEFRTPLSTIASSADLAGAHLERANPDRAAAHLDKIRRAVQHVVGILDDYLSLEKFEEGSWDDVPQEVDVAGLLRALVAQQERTLRPGQTLLLDIHPEAEGRTTFPPKVLLGIASNLISNAIKYSEEGDVVRVVLDRADLPEDGWRLTVEDEGLGISESDQALIFNRFFRSERVHHIPGTGVGLDLVARYLDGVGGTITFTSTPGEGSRFVAVWPESHPSPHNAP